MQVLCNRCHRGAEHTFASNAIAAGSQNARTGSIDVSSKCSKCQLDSWLSLRPQLMHSASNMLCELVSEGCSPIDLLPAMLGGQCGNCSAAVTFR